MKLLKSSVFITTSLSNKIKNAFKILDNAIKPQSRIIIAYSGGKDSTALILLFYEWLRRKKPRDLNIVILHNDTLDEILPMELWARNFMKQSQNIFGELGYETELLITKPSLINTFYWRVLIRGYPAPTYNFRWCVKLLKRDPTRKSLQELFSRFNQKKVILLTGLRETESIDRKRNITRRFGSYSTGKRKYLAYFFSKEDFKGIKKVAPLRCWQTMDVWALISLDSPFDVSDLLKLYTCEGARYGCWHCTVARVQWGLHTLKDCHYLYFDAARLIYRKVSDIPWLRKRKRKGYSKLGALNTAGRAIMFRLFKALERLSGRRLYGLDESRVHSGTSLREVLFHSSAEDIERVISLEDKNLDPKRRVNFSEIMYPKKRCKDLIVKSLKEVERRSRNEKSRKLILARGFDAVKEIIEDILMEF